MAMVAGLGRTGCARLARAAVVLACACSAGTVFADPLAVIAAIKGKVEVTSAHGGPPQKAAFGRALERGDAIAVAAGGSATLFFNDGNVVELTGVSTVKVGGQVGKKSAGVASLPSDVYASVAKFVTGGSRETGLVALSELRSAPVEGDAPFLIAPRRTSLMADRPTFAWRAVPGAVRYRVVLSSESGELWRREVEGLTLAFPADAAPLADSTEYLWEIAALSERAALREENSVFSVLGAEQVRTVRANLGRIRDTAGGPDSPATLFLAGSYLSGLGLYLDATEHFATLCKLTPSSPAPHEALGNVYTRVGLMDLAAAEFQQALALTRQP